MAESTKSERPELLLPVEALLDTCSAGAWTEGIQVDELEPLDTLAVETANHIYEITVINPRTAEVLVRGGDLFPERTIAWISGSSLGGESLKLHGIYIGFKLEFLADGRHIRTSKVRRIRIIKEHENA